MLHLKMAIVFILWCLGLFSLLYLDFTIQKVIRRIKK